MGIINEEEFLSDLFCMTSFSPSPGAALWDPTAWNIGRSIDMKARFYVPPIPTPTSFGFLNVSREQPIFQEIPDKVC